MTLSALQTLNPASNQIVRNAKCYLWKPRWCQRPIGFSSGMEGTPFKDTKLSSPAAGSIGLQPYPRLVHGELRNHGHRLGLSSNNQCGSQTPIFSTSAVMLLSPGSIMEVCESIFERHSFVIVSWKIYILHMNCSVKSIAYLKHILPK